MTNLTATIIISLSTNWLPVTLPSGETKEVGIVIENRHARIIYMGKTNDYLQGSYVLGQPYLREQQTVTNMTQFIQGFNGIGPQRGLLIWNGQQLIPQ